MTNLKRSFFGAAIYLALIFILGQADYTDWPLINFANYFYVTVLIALPLTLFFPGIARVSTYVPLGIWGTIYFVLLLTLPRNLSAKPNDLAIISLEFILLEVGVWYAHQLALQISHAESIMDTLAVSAFPNRARDLDTEDERIKIELTRSRRYHRPLSVVLIESESREQKIDREMMRSIQHDLMNRFTSARVAQIIDESIRQTDMVMRDYRGGYVILCPETDVTSASLLAKRISEAIKARVDLHVLWGVAAFPEEALTFEELLQKARERLQHPELIPSEPDAVAVESR